MAKQHLKYAVLKIYLNAIEAHKFQDANIKPQLILLAKVFALDELTTDCQQCFASGYFHEANTYSNLQQAYKMIIKELRPQILPLAEAFRIPDKELTSAIGNSHGDIYETQFDWAKNSHFNKQSSIPEPYNKYMKPILKGKL